MEAEKSANEGIERRRRIIFSHPELWRSPQTKVVWLWLDENMKMLYPDAKEGTIYASIAVIADGLGMTDHRSIRLAITELENLGALKLVDRDVAAKHRLRGQLRVYLCNPSTTLMSQRPGIATDAQSELFPTGRSHARLIPARPSIRAEKIPAGPEGQPSANAHSHARENAHDAHSHARENAHGENAEEGQLDSAKGLNGDSPPIDAHFHARENAHRLHGSIEEVYVPSSVHSSVSMVPWRAQEEALQRQQGVAEKIAAATAETPTATRFRRYAPWPIEVSLARRGDTPFLKERLYEALKEEISLLIEADAAPDARADAAKAELVRMQGTIVADPACHWTIFARMADAILEGDVAANVVADVLANMIGIERSEKGFTKGAGAFYHVSCRRAFAAVGRPWKLKQETAAHPR